MDSAPLLKAVSWWSVGGKTSKITDLRALSALGDLSSKVLPTEAIWQTCLKSPCTYLTLHWQQAVPLKATAKFLLMARNTVATCWFLPALRHRKTSCHVLCELLFWRLGKETAAESVALSCSMEGEGGEDSSWLCSRGVGKDVTVWLAKTKRKGFVSTCSLLKIQEQSWASGALGQQATTAVLPKLPQNILKRACLKGMCSIPEITSEKRNPNHFAERRGTWGRERDKSQEEDSATSAYWVCIRNDHPLLQPDPGRAQDRSHGSCVKPVTQRCIAGCLLENIPVCK